MWRNALHDDFHIEMCHCVVSAKIMHHQACIHFEVEEAGKEGIGLVRVDAGLASQLRFGILIHLKS